MQLLYSQSLIAGKVLFLNEKRIIIKENIFNVSILTKVAEFIVERNNRNTERGFSEVFVSALN